MNNDILVPLELAEYLWFDNQDDPIELFEWREYKFINYDNLIEANNCNLINELKDAINDALIYLGENALEYLEEDAINRIIDNAKKEEEDPRIWIWQTVYEVIKDMDSSPEQEYWFISWVKYAVNILSNN